MVAIQFVILAVLIIFSALFSGIETALMSLNQAKVNSLLKKKRKGSAALSRIKSNPHKLIITILIGNNLVNIGAASFATVVFTELFGSGGVGIATGVMTFLILVFGEITPKTFATQNAERVSLIVARPVELLSIILTPVVKVLELISKIMSRILGSKEEAEISEEELRSVVTMGADEGIINREAAEIMHNVLEFRGTETRKIMTPDVNVLMVDGDKKLREVLDFIVKTPYSRYPVFSKSRDKIEGILDVDSVLESVHKKKLNTKVRTISRPALFVPESKEIDGLLTEFEKKKIQIAVVVNEYGEVSGVVTLEDILEEIVGDIFDKSKRDQVFYRGKKFFHVDAKMTVSEVNKILGINLDIKKYNTLAGFITKKLKKIPRKGESIESEGHKFEVVRVNRQGIESIKVSKL